MMTHLKRHPQNRLGFTLVEILVAITIIAILAGVLTVAVGGVFKRAQEFTITNEMTQLESALEQFKNDYGFYPPSFKDFVNEAANNGDAAAANLVLTYLNRISPNNAESQVIDPNTGQRRIDLWWTNVGRFIGQNPGSELVFWLSSLSENRQFPLTFTDTNGTVFALTAHNKSTLAGDPDRQVYFEFDDSRLEFVASDAVAIPLQAAGAGVAYLYRDAGINYFPNDPTDMDDNTGAYVNAFINDPDSGMRRRPTRQDIVDAFFHLDPVNHPNPNMVSVAFSQTMFNELFPNFDTYQLISFGLDGEPGGPATCPTPLDANPNIISSTCAAGADNMVNFGGAGVTKLQVVIEELN